MFAMHQDAQKFIEDFVTKNLAAYNKTTLACLANLPKALPKSTVEYASDSEDLEYHPDTPEHDDVSDSDLEGPGFDLDDDEEAEIQDDARLLNFLRVLQQAQEIAAEAEREKRGETKRPRRYLGNSGRTL
ncbi:hypothetical protein BJV78DRAFT_1158597 [Lactifluus subvellereus]|nr:hypothetical protein BJV78DRAFT_1158597 [Lactifluus subvellereus]